MYSRDIKLCHHSGVKVSCEKDVVVNEACFFHLFIANFNGQKKINYVSFTTTFIYTFKIIIIPERRHNCCMRLLVFVSGE